VPERVRVRQPRAQREDPVVLHQPPPPEELPEEAPVTLVEELRRRASRVAEHGSSTDFAVCNAYNEAAELVEADPLYKAAPELVRLTRSALRQLEAHGVGFVDPPTRLIELLATLPKEG